MCVVSVRVGGVNIQGKQDSRGRVTEKNSLRLQLQFQTYHDPIFSIASVKESISSGFSSTLLAPQLKK